MRIVLVKCREKTSNFYDSIFFQLLEVPIAALWCNGTEEGKKCIEDLALQRNITAQVYTSKDLHTTHFFWKESVNKNDVIVIVYSDNKEAVLLYEMFGQKNHSKENSTFSGKMVSIHCSNKKFEKAELIL